MRSPRAKLPKCKTCKGQKTVFVEDKPQTMVFSATYKRATCPDCAGTGRVSFR